MKAIIYTQYGGPEVLQLAEVEKPAPNDEQVLVKVRAASVNPADWHRMTAPLAFRAMIGGFRKPKDPRLGVDIAGVVEAVGSSVTQFKPGDAVFGVCAGGFAEYAVARENRLALKPTGVSFEAAAASPVVGFTALQGLCDTGQIQAGQTVLINGAAGGVGTFAVQIAKVYGAQVTGVCSTRNLDMVRSIGADHVVDYTREDFTRTGQQYNLIYDAIGNRSVFDYRRALAPQGRCVTAGFTSISRLLEYAVVGKLMSKFGSRWIGSMGVAKSTKEDLLVIRDLLETGKVVPVIGQCYPLSETAKALQLLGTRHAQGKLIILMEDQRK